MLRPSLLVPGGKIAKVLSRPWVDPVILWMLKEALPASHAWALAAKVRGDSEDFAKALGMDRLPWDMKVKLARTERLRSLHEAAQRVWEEDAFDPLGHGRNLAIFEADRRKKAQDFFINRFSYIGFAHRQRIEAASFSIPSLASLRQELATALSNPGDYFRPSNSVPKIEQSPRIDRGDIVEYWLRFPSMTDRTPDYAIVHVYEPKTKSFDPIPSFIFGHGLAMETEMLAKEMSDYPRLARAGVRILLPDAPGHNRRIEEGSYGGESFLREAPQSSIRHFRSSAFDYATLIAWCRANGSKRVALGGISLGALSAQVAASHWHEWSQEQRADYLFLVTTTDAISQLPLVSSLASILGLDEALREKGWNESELATLAPLTDAKNEPPLDPKSIIMVLGKRDTLTPFAGGQNLVKKWSIPPENCFIGDQGHFSAAIGLRANPEPFRRLLSLLQ